MRLIILSISALFSLIAFSSTASAEPLRFCSTASVDVFVAYGSYNSSGTWQSKGWYRIEPGRCRNVISNTSRSTRYYFYANSANTEGRWFWHGDTDQHRANAAIFCIDRVDEFDWSSANSSGCDTSGLVSRSFRLAERQSRGFTVTLTASGLGNVALRDREFPNHNPNGGAAAAAILGGLLLWGLGAEGNRRAEEDACMRRCTQSRARCYELCTQ